MLNLIDSENIFEIAAEKFVEIANDSIEKRGFFTVALSGGSTPKKLYSLLASAKFRPRIDWTKTRIFFGDERFVPKDSDESNFRMANETLLSKIKIPQKNIHRFLTEKGEVKKVAKEMEDEIRQSFKLKKNEFPQFDLILLGMGDDGHTASLFPQTEALKEDKRIITENYVPKFNSFRLTFTVPTINNARNIMFLISGENKSEIFRKVFDGEYQPSQLPSQLVNPAKGNLYILKDFQ